MTKTKYNYVPQVGTRFKLRLWEDYENYAPNLGVWAWFTCREIWPTGVRAEHYNAGDTGTFLSLPLEAIAPPIGWKERYTVYAEPGQLDNILGWIRDKRGIAVRASHALENAGTVAFQPADNCESPHWQFVELTDLIPPEQVTDRISVVKLEREMDPQVDGRYLSQMDRKERKQAVSAMNANHWMVGYEKRCAYWWRERETIVKHYGEEVL